MANELKYWHDGHPIIPGTVAVPDELDYWSDGSPYTYIEIAASTGTLKSMNGIALASIKSVSGIAIANIKSVNGLTAT